MNQRNFPRRMRKGSCSSIRAFMRLSGTSDNGDESTLHLQNRGEFQVKDRNKKVSVPNRNRPRGQGTCSVGTLLTRRQSNNVHNIKIVRWKERHLVQE